MNVNGHDNQKQQSVIAIAKTDEQLRAVEIRENNGTFELLWTKSSAAGETSWKAFAAECGLSTGPKEQVRFDDNGEKIVVVGFDSAGTAFYRLSTPPVEKKEIEAIVKLQAESRLPLPVEQMEFAWRTDGTYNGQVAITMAASRKLNVQTFVDKVRDIQPAQILLDCEAVVKAWTTLFSKSKKDAVIINASDRNTQACLIVNGRLSNSVTLDMGIKDFTDSIPEEQIETAERYIQDIIGVVDLLNQKRTKKIPVIVLSDGSDAFTGFISALKSAGLNAQAAPPKPAKQLAQIKLKAEDIYKYRVPIGLALTAIDTDVDNLNLFENVYHPADKEEQRHWLYTPKVAYTITAVAIALFVIITYAVTTARPGAIEEHIKASGAEADINSLMERQKLKKVIAQQRPDLLDLLNEITSCGQNGQNNRRSGPGQNNAAIELESFHFKKGQPVTITGQASNNNQFYSFEKNLEEKSDIKDVKPSANQNTSTANARGGDRSKKIKFTITFHYKNFTK